MEVEEFETSSLMKTLQASILKKEDLFNKSKSRYFMRSMLACLYLTIGTAAAVYLGEIVNTIVPGGGKIAYALMFTWSLVMIIYLNAELGTSNMMYMTTAVHRRILPLKKAATILLACVFFNLVGGILASWLISHTGAFLHVTQDSFLVTTIASKLQKGPSQVFFEGIFANLIVNIAVFVTINLKEDTARILAIVFLIFIFAFLGFEHVIANFSSFSLAFFATGGHVPGMIVIAVLKNIFFATIGNFVGGGLLLGLNYSWLNNGKSKYSD